MSAMSDISSIQSEDDHADQRSTMNADQRSTMNAGPVPSPGSRATRRHRAIGPGAAGWEAPRAFDVDELEVSEDTDGSMPPSPTPGEPGLGGIGAAALDDDRAPVEPQVTMCRWEQCDVGNLGNMDLLVEHIHEEHIHSRQKRYSCEWEGCGRKGFSHASAYALRAHMRSHTKEKPFYCSLPECDRSFTRSDALAKHMRTIHETESSRVYDTGAKHILAVAGGKSGRTKSQSHAGVADTARSPPPSDQPDEWSHDNVVFHPVMASDREESDSSDQDEDRRDIIEAEDGLLVERRFPPDVHFTADELALCPSKLYKRLKAQARWASNVNSDLTSQINKVSERERREWALKELVLEKAMLADLSMHEKKMGLKRKLDDPSVQHLLNEMRHDVGLSRLESSRDAPKITVSSESEDALPHRFY